MRRAISASQAAFTSSCGVALIQGAKDYDFGMAAVRAAVDINPNSVRVNICAAVANLHCGSLDLALVQSQRALRLSPRDPDAYIPLCATAMIHILRGEHGQALEWATRSVTINPNFDPVYWMLAAANAHLGRMDKARAALAELNRRTPSATIASIRSGQPAFDPSRLAPILEGLRLAGLPEA